jgi:glycosyl transferase family 25
LKKRGLDPNIISGIDGSKLPSHILKTHVASYYAKVGPKSAIGCALSHFKAWRTFLQTDQPWAVVLEDDVILKRRFTKNVSDALENVPPDFDLLYLGCFNSPFFKHVFSLMNLDNSRARKLDNGIEIPKVALAAHAYVVSRKGATLLLKLLDGKLFNHLDVCLQTLASNGSINTLACTPRIAFQTSTNELNKSSNATTHHPIALNYALSKMSIDKMVKASYATTCSLLQLGQIHITLSSVLIFLSGWLLSGWSQLTLYYLLISIPDVMSLRISPNAILFHYFLFMLPTAVSIQHSNQN